MVNDVRKFWLRNEIGKTYSFMGKLDDNTDKLNNSGFLNQPQGLGMSKTNQYVKIGNTWVKVSSSPNLQNISGELILKDYNEYMLFNNFVASASELRLYQELPLNINLVGLSDVPEFYTIVDMMSIDKGELDNDLGILRCPISFDQIKPWSTEVIVSRAIDIQGQAGSKKYDYTYDDDGKTSPVYGSNTSSKITINNIGTASTYPIITMTGAVNNPVITVKNFNTGNIVFQMALDISVLPGETLVINFDPADYSVTKDGSNVFGSVSGVYDSELELPTGKYTVEVLQGATEDVGEITLSYSLNFWSV